MNSEEILKNFSLKEEILNIYPYGSRVYGTFNEESDYDFIVVAKPAFLSDGSFKMNAKSSEDRKIQIIMYSRTGFIDAINNYDMSALECLSLEENQIIRKIWQFKINKINSKELAKKVIFKSSNSWHLAEMQSKGDLKRAAKKGIFHALRILDFGIQFKKNNKIVDFSSCNDLWKEISSINDEEFNTGNFISMRDSLMNILKS